MLFSDRSEVHCQRRDRWPRRVRSLYLVSTMNVAVTDGKAMFAGDFLVMAALFCPHGPNLVGPLLPYFVPQ